VKWTGPAFLSEQDMQGPFIGFPPSNSKQRSPCIAKQSRIKNIVLLFT